MVEQGGRSGRCPRRHHIPPLLLGAPGRASFPGSGKPDLDVTADAHREDDGNADCSSEITVSSKIAGYWEHFLSKIVCRQWELGSRRKLRHREAQHLARHHTAW